MPVQVHISGITRPEDAEAAVEAGADGFGLYFWPQSTSSVTVDRAKEIVGVLPDDALTVGMFVDAVASVVERTLESTGIKLALFAGNEDPQYCRRFSGHYAKVIRVRNLASIEAISDYDCPFFVLDGDPAVHAGVREVPFDLNLARRAKRFGKVIVSGGLTVDTVEAAVRAARPYGLEVSSGVESTQGIKSAKKLAKLIEKAKSA